jgi:hypothetical protein
MHRHPLIGLSAVSWKTRGLGSILFDVLTTNTVTGLTRFITICQSTEGATLSSKESHQFTVQRHYDQQLHHPYNM